MPSRIAAVGLAVSLISLSPGAQAHQAFAASLRARDKHLEAPALKDAVRPPDKPVIGSVAPGIPVEPEDAPLNIQAPAQAEPGELHAEFPGDAPPPATESLRQGAEGGRRALEAGDALAPGQALRLTSFPYEASAKVSSEKTVEPVLAEVPAAVSPPGGGVLAAKKEAPAPGDSEIPGRAEPPAPPAASGRYRFAALAPNLATALNLASGLGAMVYAVHGAVLPAAGLIFLANVFDALDGRLARALKVSSPMGIELDSLADVVSFGAAPALLAYQAALSPLGLFGFAAAAAYAFAGAYRLARFNLAALSPPAAQAWPKPDAFTGLPIPAGAGVVLSAVFAAGLLPAAWAAPMVALAAAAAAAAMVSTAPYPAFKKGGAKALARPALLALAAALPLAWLGVSYLIPAAVFGPYLLSGPASLLARKSSARAKRPPAKV